MRLFTKSSVLLFALLLGGIVVPRAKASAENVSGADAAIDLQAPVNVSYLTDLVGPSAESALPDDPEVAQDPSQSASPTPAQKSSADANQPDLAQGRQTKRILFVVPNFRAVSADQHLPPQTVKEKFKTAALDSFDYSSFIFVGGQAGVAQWSNSYPEFGQGAKGYGRYYWHTLADEINENTWVEFIVPALLHQDTRYYTLGRGGVVKRLGYAFTRIAITRTDSGHETFNFSEFLGAGAFSGVANLYYPGQERTVTKTYQRWIENLAIDSCVFAFKEIWPDINNAIFHQKD
jgi:hypothetical protein